VVARAGGLAIFAGFLAAIVYLALNGSIGTYHLKVIVSGGAVMLLLGLWDDIRGTSPRVKFAVQSAVASALILNGVRIGFLPSYLSVPLTLLWIVGVTNAVNLEDGMDGLAAGISSVACFIFFLAGLMQGNDVLVLMSLALSGSCLGFLKHNFFPASIFMGDTGSMFLGYMLSVLGVISTLNVGGFLNLFVPVLILGVPVFDTLIVMTRRFLRHENIFKSDRSHFYDLMLDSRRLSYEQVVIAIYVFSMLLGAGSLCLI
jgi:UDP-GlcNAc:undecaprenyl-phosphate GlcNAc-1-phosphate transferase